MAFPQREIRAVLLVGLLCLCLYAASLAFGWEAWANRGLAGAQISLAAIIVLLSIWWPGLGSRSSKVISWLKVGSWFIVMLLAIWLPESFGRVKTFLLAMSVFGLPVHIVFALWGRIASSDASQDRSNRGSN